MDSGYGTSMRQHYTANIYVSCLSQYQSGYDFTHNHPKSLPSPTCHVYNICNIDGLFFSWWVDTLLWLQQQ